MQNNFYYIFQSNNTAFKISVPCSVSILCGALNCPELPSKWWMPGGLCDHSHTQLQLPCTLARLGTQWEALTSSMTLCSPGGAFLPPLHHRGSEGGSQHRRSSTGDTVESRAHKPGEQCIRGRPVFGTTYRWTIPSVWMDRSMAGQW